MLNAASRGGSIEGLVPHLVVGGLTHLQYTDDTIIFLKNSDSNLCNLKFILFCYEAMSGIKINYNKSEIFVMGIDSEAHGRIADIMNCRVGNFPIAYLGLPVSDCKLTKAQLNYVNENVKNRLGT